MEKKYKIVLEPAKKNTAPAILASALIKEIPNNQPLMYKEQLYISFINLLTLNHLYLLENT